MAADWERVHRAGCLLQRDLLELTGAETPPAPAARMFGSGSDEIARRMAFFEERTRNSLWNFRDRAVFDPHGYIEQLDARSRARGVREIDIISPYVYESCAVPGLIRPGTMIGPAAFQGIILDGGVVLFAGSPTPKGQPTAWVTQHRSIVDRTLTLWDEIRRLAKPIPARTGPDRDELRIAELIARGHTNRRIAATVGVSVRTLERRIAALERHLKVSDRAELAALIATTGR